MWIILVSTPRGHLEMCGGFLVVTNRVLLGIGQRPALRLNTPQCPGQPSQQWIIQPKTLVVQSLKNPPIDENLNPLINHSPINSGLTTYRVYWRKKSKLNLINCLASTRRGQHICHVKSQILSILGSQVTWPKSWLLTLQQLQIICKQIDTMPFN